MTASDVVTAPLGYIDFCARFPDQCGEGSRRLAASMTADQGAGTNRRYFWLAAFDRQSPSSVGRRGGYDWQRVFKTAAPQPTSERQPETQSFAPANSATPHLSKELWTELENINRDVNAKIRPIHDLDQFGYEDYWTLPIATGTLAGDCKDYVLEKRRLLMAAGLPMASLSITLGTTAWGEYHAVLLVHTDQGDYVLDNLSPWVTPWKDVTYKWSKRQSAADPDVWVRPTLAEN